MKKRFWVRLISAVLTMAMAFSILAVPASAAEADTNTVKLTAIGRQITIDADTTWIFWYMYDFFAEKGLLDLWNACESAAQSSKYVTVTHSDGSKENYYLNVDEAPTDAYIGISLNPTSNVFWYTEEAFNTFDEEVGDDESEALFDSDTGVITIGSAKLSPIGSSSSSLKLTAIGRQVMVDADTVLTVWYMYDFFAKEGLLDLWEACEKAAQSNRYTTVTRPDGSTENYYLNVDETPADAYVGISLNPTSEIFWYTEEAYSTFAKEIGDDESEVVFDSNTGVLTLGSAKLKPIGYSGSSTGGSASVSASADGGAAILLVGGAAVAATAATGLYFYTHPEKVQEIKDSVHAFVENIQNKFQSILPSRDVEEAPAA